METQADTILLKIVIGSCGVLLSIEAAFVWRPTKWTKLGSVVSAEASCKRVAEEESSKVRFEVEHITEVTYSFLKTLPSLRF
jgi:hypothetical protein